MLLFAILLVHDAFDRFKSSNTVSDVLLQYCDNLSLESFKAT